jgi:hypothetical protein
MELVAVFFERWCLMLTSTYPGPQAEASTGDCVGLSVNPDANGHLQSLSVFSPSDDPLVAINGQLTSAAQPHTRTAS